MTWSDEIAAKAREQLAFINRNRDVYIRAWFAETGLLPSESEMVERVEYDGGAIIATVTIRRRGNAA